MNIKEFQWNANFSMKGSYDFVYIAYFDAIVSRLFNSNGTKI